MMQSQLPKELFNQETNPSLLAQAVRVYESLLHPLRGRAKTRGEVVKTTAKWYRQKGTGKARHGSKSAPIFVGGGIAHGPRGVRRKLKLSKRVVSLALRMALSEKAKAKQVSIIGAAELTPKTSSFVAVLKKIGALKGNILFLHAQEENTVKSSSNVKNVTVKPAASANTYDVLKASYLLISENGMGVLKKKFGLPEEPKEQNSSKKVRIRKQKVSE